MEMAPHIIIYYTFVMCVMIDHHGRMTQVFWIFPFVMTEFSRRLILLSHTSYASFNSNYSSLKFLYQLTYLNDCNEKVIIFILIHTTGRNYGNLRKKIQNFDRKCRLKIRKILRGNFFVDLQCAKLSFLSITFFSFASHLLFALLNLIEIFPCPVHTFFVFECLCVQSVCLLLVLVLERKKC